MHVLLLTKVSWNLKLVNILNKYSKKNMDANADIVNDDDVVDGAGFQYSNVPILTPLYNWDQLVHPSHNQMFGPKTALI